MSSNNILKFGVPIARQTAQAVSSVPVRSQTGQCGIPPYTPPPPPPVHSGVVDLPSHLIRPPCMPGSQGPRLPPNCSMSGLGMYCPVQRLKYKYPPFSENIDFVPTGSVECWWTKPPTCDVGQDEEEELPIRLP